MVERYYTAGSLDEYHGLTLFVRYFKDDVFVSGLATPAYLEQEVTKEVFDNYVELLKQTTENESFIQDGVEYFAGLIGRGRSLVDTVGKDQLDAFVTNGSLLNKTSNHAAQIDGEVDEIYKRFELRKTEYDNRYNEAEQFLAGTLPDGGLYLSSFATAAGMSLTDAANLVVQQYANALLASAALGDLRMQKFRISGITDLQTKADELDSVLAQIKAIGAQV